jgi:hypothetical protein
MTEAAQTNGINDDMPTSWWTRRLLRAEPWPLLIVSLLLFLAFCWWYSTPIIAKVAINYYGDFCYGFVLFVAIVAGRGIQLFVAMSCARHRGLSFEAVRSRRRFWPWLGVIVVMTLVTVREEVPMYVGFYLSRPGLDSLADEALADRANAHRLVGRWAGGYRVAGVEVIGETVVLYLDHPEGNYGFARVPGARSDHIYNMSHTPEGPENHRAFPPYNGRKATDPVGQRIGGDWFVVYSSYWRVKVGWS